MIEYNEIYDLFITKNLSAEEIRKEYGYKYITAIKYYNLKKTREQKAECRRRTCLKKYGVDNVSKANEIKKKKRETALEHYGVEIPMHCKEVKDAWKNTILEKYGCSNAMQNKEVKKKQQDTNLKRYGYKNSLSSPEIREKYKRTMVEKYGVDNPQKNKDIQLKTINTRIEKYGDSRMFGSKSFYEKSKETCKSRYNVEYAMQNEEVKQKIIEQLPQSIIKGINTKRKNKSFNGSKIEEYVYILLILKFGEVFRQYRSELYPYLCDFYIPSLHLYIELNCHWTHGGEPFTGSEEQLLILEEWKEKAKTSKFYGNAIDVWTVADVKKLNTFKQNNLNYLIFYSKKQFEDWFRTI